MKLISVTAIPVFLLWLTFQPSSNKETYRINSAVQHTVANDLFASEDVLQISLTGSVGKLFSDRGDAAVYHPFVLTYKQPDNKEVSVPLKAKTRGNFRRMKGNCTYPPILLNFQKLTNGNTLFEQQDKMKLVTPCRDEKYVIREYLVYKLYNLITPKSFRARLAKVVFFDSDKKREAATFYSILLEEDEQMAKRNGTKILEKKRVNGESTETETFLKMAVFQYMIGNTDWSIQYLHNIRLLAIDSFSIPSVVPYDFDHSGIVNAPYALPPEALELRSTQERRFRGYCITDWKTMDAVIATYNRLRKDIYNVYTSNTLLDAKSISATTKFLDGFYETINNPKKMKEEFSYPCRKDVPNFIIKGLQKD